MRALLVVHDTASRESLERVLVRRRCTVTRGDHAGQAVAFCREAAESLVLVDEAALAADPHALGVAGSQTGGTAHFLGIVPADAPDALERMIGAGADDVLTYPFADHEADARVAVALSRLGRGNRSTSQPSLPDLHTEDLERELRVQQAFLESLFEAAPEGVAILDSESRVVRLNGEFTRLFGYSSAEAAGQPINDLIVPPDLRTEAIELDGGIRRGQGLIVETVRRHREGHLIDVSVLATPVEANGPAGAFAIYRDITEKKRREAAVRESEARYRALFDQSPVGVFLCDENLRITHCNDYLSQVVEAPYEEIVGAGLQSLRNSRLLPGLRAALRGEPAFYEGPYRTPSGKQLYVSVQYAPLRDEAGEVIGGIGVLEDISDRLMAEKQRRAQAAEMERVNSALRERTLELEAAIQARIRLYSAMNHELRTPISAVMLYQELLIAGSLGPLAEEQRRALEHSHTATRHLLDLVSDILDLSKIEAGKVTVQPVEVAVPEALAELQAAVSPLTERYGSELRLEVAPGVETIVTDPQRLRQILMNLVSNAAKYGRRAPIDVRARSAAGSGLVIEVEDRGVGIAEADLQQIFDEFVQLDSEHQEGTGLGLAISRRLAGLLHGRLEVESEVGVGSLFRLVLPDMAEEAKRRQVEVA
ncbi:MAG: PAS domain S-box protein [Gemmatimonadota bacterium]